jgi:hypothetical protein
MFPADALADEGDESMSRMHKLLGIAAGAALFGMTSLAGAANLAISIGVRETGTAAAIGDNGGTANGIEFVNLDGLTLPIDGAFHTMQINFGTDPVTAFAGATANGVLDGTRGVLEHIRIRNIDGVTAPMEIWIDNIRNTTAQGTFTVSDFEGFAPGLEVTFQEPGFSGSTSGFLMPTPNSSLTTDLVSSQGTISDDVKFQFINGTTTNWVRLTTNATPNRPNPTIEFAPGNTLTFDMRVLIVPEPASATLLGLGSLGLLTSRRRK